jgi:hypothetical protein
VEGKTLALAVGATGLGAIALGTLLLYMGEPPPPPDPPKPPPPPEVTMNATLKYSPSVYRALIETDARTYKVPIPTPEQLGQPNKYFEELKGHRRLKARDKKLGEIETPHLRPHHHHRKKTATLEGQSFAVDHLVLRIQNRTARYLAYRIETSVTDKHKCSTKGDIPHNAMVLEPNQTIERTECLYRADEAIDVTHVEVIELPPARRLLRLASARQSHPVRPAHVGGPHPAHPRALPADLLLARHPGGHREARDRVADVIDFTRDTTATSTRSFAATGTEPAPRRPSQRARSTKSSIFASLAGSS